MSVWTHIHGMVRIRTYNDSHKKVKQDIKFIKEILGPQDYDNPDHEVEGITLPEGSEGALKYNINAINRIDLEQVYDRKEQKWLDKWKHVTKPDELIVTFFGDLRDLEMPPSRYEGMYDNTKDIDDWFRDFIDKLQADDHYMDIRGATLCYECEESNTGWMLQAISGPEFHSPMVVVKQMIPKSDQLRHPWHEESEMKGKK